MVEDQERQREMNKNDRWKVPKTTLGDVQSIRAALLNIKYTALGSRATGGLGHTSPGATEPRSLCRAHQHLHQDHGCLVPALPEKWMPKTFHSVLELEWWEKNLRHLKQKWCSTKCGLSQLPNLQCPWNPAFGKCNGTARLQSRHRTFF